MKIQINFADVPTSDSLSEHTTQSIQKALEHMADDVTRVEVHLRDDKRRRRGPDDKRCTIEARIAGDRPMAVRARTDDIYKSVADAAAKLGRAVSHRLDRCRA